MGRGWSSPEGHWSLKESAYISESPFLRHGRVGLAGFWPYKIRPIGRILGGVLENPATVSISF
jgi:hypothetical protein